MLLCDIVLFCCFQGLAEAKMDLRRQDHAVRQLNKQMSHLENDKRALHERLTDAEKALHATAKWVPQYQTVHCLHVGSLSKLGRRRQRGDHVNFTYSRAPFVFCNQFNCFTDVAVVVARPGVSAA